MEFYCPDPKATVRAINVRATLDAFKLQPLFAKSLLEPFGLDVQEAQADQFVPLQRWLDALKHVQGELGSFVLRNVGSAVAAQVLLPQGLSSVEEALEQLDAIHELNHRGNVGHYRVTRGTDGLLSVRCETPYPRHFERGFIESLLRDPRLGTGRRYSAQYTEAPPRTPYSCTLTVRASDSVTGGLRAVASVGR